MAKLNVGTHVSIAGSLDRAIPRAAEIGCTTFQIFTRNPRGWAFSPISQEERGAFAEGLRRAGLSPVVDHMPYLPNLASPTPEVYEKSVATFKAELLRCDMLGIPYLVTHLGSHLGTGMDAGRGRIVSALDEAIALKTRCMVLLENTAGQRNSLGTTFGDLLAIIEKAVSPGRIGICLDTCHAFAAGYDVKTKFSEVLDELDSAVGIGRLKVMHMNDAIGGLGSHLDRHYHIGLGEIGEDGFRNILADERIHALPLIMETPIDERRDDRGNIEKLHELAPH
jgi:deoxyribonuclease-4